MKKYILIPALLILAHEVHSCTLLWASRNNEILCAKNMDWSNPDSRMLFIPASDGKYGRVYFGIECIYGFTNTSGMNEMGLWYGSASLPERTDIYNTYDKPLWDYELIEKVMEECATVDEAVEIFSEYWEPHWDGHTLIADRSGNCAVIEYGENDVVFIRHKQNHQVLTNFYLCDTINSRWYNCYRYNVAKTMLEDSARISFRLFRNITEATHAKGKFQTVLTTIHDLQSGDIQIYYMHNFHEFITINIFDELEKGQHYIKCSDFYSSIKICIPENGAEVTGLNTKVVWTGESDKYRIHYSKYPDFSEQFVISYSDHHSLYQKSGSFKGIIILVIPVMFILAGRKINKSLIFPLLLFVMSCEKADIEPQYSKKVHEQIISGLEPQTTYYWKVSALDEEYPSNSITSCFKTL